MEKLKKMRLYGREHYLQFDKIIRDYKIAYLTASFGWESEEFVYGYLKSMGKDNSIITDSNTMENELDRLKRCSRESPVVMIVTDFENVIKNNQLEEAIRTLKSLPKELKLILISTLPLSTELVSFSLSGNLIRIGIRELRPSKEEVRTFFRKQGIILNNHELERIKRDFDYMPICLYLLADYLKESVSGYNSYIKNSCWEEVFAYMDMTFFQVLAIDIQDMLLRLGYFKSINAGFLEAVFAIDRRESVSILKHVYHHGNILKKDGDDNYVFYPLVSRFLQRYIEKYVDMAEREKIYRKAVKYYIKERNDQETLRFLIILKEDHKLAFHLSEILKDLSVIKCKELEQYLEMLPFGVLRHYPVLIAGKVILEYCKGNKAQTMYWHRILETMEADRDGKLWLQYLSIVLPILEEDDAINNLKSGIGKKYIGRTDHALYMVHGGRDFSLYAKEYVEALNQAEKHERDRGRESGLPEIFNGEIWYEKNEFEKAISSITRGLKAAAQRKDDMLAFAGKFTLCNIMLYGNQREGAADMLNHIGNLAEKLDDQFSQGNFQALAALYYLTENNYDMIEVWMNRWAPDEHGEFCILFCYQYLIKARIYILRGQYMSAQSLLDILKEYLQHFDMPYVRLKIAVLESILYYRKENEKWSEILDEALALGEKTGFIRVFADEGRAVHELLLKKCFKQRFKKSQYVNQLVKAAKRTMLLYPHYLQDKKNMAELTGAEMQVLKLLTQGKKNIDIARQLVISENTVKYHLKNIYVKMEVSNRSQAIKIAVDFNIIENYLFE